MKTLWIGLLLGLATPAMAQQPRTARDYFEELRAAGQFNHYTDKYVCFPQDEATTPTFRIVSANADVIEAIKNDDKPIIREKAGILRTLEKAGDVLWVQTFNRGVSNNESPDPFDKMENDPGYYRDFTKDPIKHGRIVFSINWSTGRYRFKVYDLDYSVVPAMEMPGKCELIHDGDTPSVKARPGSIRQ